MAGQSPPCLNPNWLFEVARQQNDYLVAPTWELLWSDGLSWIGLR